MVRSRLNMALTVFPLPEVGEVYNKNFVCLKIDAEKGEGRELAKKYGIHSYPSYIFVNPKTETLIHRSGGNKPAADFIARRGRCTRSKAQFCVLNGEIQEREV